MKSCGDLKQKNLRQDKKMCVVYCDLTWSMGDDLDEISGFVELGSVSVEQLLWIPSICVIMKAGEQA